MANEQTPQEQTQQAPTAIVPTDWAAEAAKFGGSVAAPTDWAAEAAKFGGTVSKPQEPSLSSKIWEGVKQSMPVQTAKQLWDLSLPPRDSREHALAAVGGPPAVVAYRAGKAVVDQAEAMFTSPRENYERSRQDFLRAVQDYHNKDYHNLASSIGSLTGDIMSDVPSMEQVGPRVRELAEGTRPGGNLVTPITKDIIDVGTMALGSEAAGKGLRVIREKVGSVIPDRAADMTPAEHLEEANKRVYKAAPPTKAGAKGGYNESLKDVMPDLTIIANKTPNIETPMDMADAIDAHIKRNDARLVAEAERTRGVAEAEMSGLETKVQKALDEAWHKTEGKYTEDEITKANDAIIDRIRTLRADSDNPGQYKDPTLFQVDNLRRRFAEDTKDAFGPKAKRVPAADDFAKLISNEVMRNDIDDKFEDLGIPGVKDWRLRESKLIDVRENLENATQASTNAGQWNALKSLSKHKGWGLLPVITGLWAGGPLGGIGTLATELGLDWMYDQSVNPNIQIQKAVKSLRDAGVSSEAAVPGKPPTATKVAPVAAKSKDETIPKVTAATAAGAAQVASAEEKKPLAKAPEEEPESEEVDIPTLLDKAAQEHGIPPNILHAQAAQESKLDPNAVSKKGAKGVMQLTDKTAEALGVDSSDTAQNIDGGTRYLKQLHDRFKRWDRALAAYNWGPGKVQQAIDEHGTDWLEHAPLETQKYVHRILREATK